MDLIIRQYTQRKLNWEECIFQFIVVVLVKSIVEGLFGKLVTKKKKIIKYPANLCMPNRMNELKDNSFFELSKKNKWIKRVG